MEAISGLARFPICSSWQVFGAERNGEQSKEDPIEHLALFFEPKEFGAQRGAAIMMEVMIIMRLTGA